MACSCLLANPPDYDEAEDLWPVFVRTDPAPLVEVDLEADDFPAGLVSSFGAIARDGNIDQDLHYRWFLDYTADDPERQPFCGRLDDQPLRPTGEPERIVAAPIGRWHELLDAGYCHRVTLVVTDGDFAEDGCAAVVEPAHRISTDWWLGVHDTDTPLASVDFSRCLSEQKPLSR